MQNTLPLAPTHPAKALTGLAKQIALPHEFAPERFPSFPALERTAVMGFCQPATLELPASTPVKMMLSRQAAYPLWADFDPGTFAYQAGYMTSTGGIASNDTVDLPIVGAVTWSQGNEMASTNYVGVSGHVATGPYTPMGVDGGDTPFIWMPSNSYLTVSLLRPNLVGGISARVSIEFWVNPGQFDTYTMPTATWNDGYGSISVQSSAPAGNWLRPRSVWLSSDGSAGFTGPLLVQLTVTRDLPTITNSPGPNFPMLNAAASAGSCFLPVTYPAEFANSRMPWYSTRTTAAAVLGTNVSQVLNKAGTILAGRVAPAVTNPFRVASSYINTLHPAEKAWLPCETGVYTFCPPSTDLSAFWDYTAHWENQYLTTVAPVYRLDNDSLVNVMFITAGAVAEQLALTLDWHVEFRTTSALFQIGLSTMPLEVLHQAQIALTSAGFFFENPEHKAVLNKVLSAVKRYGPQVANIAAMALPQYATAFRGAKMILPKVMGNKMQPTSAANSGITPKPKGNRGKKPPPPKKGKGKKGKR